MRSPSDFSVMSSDSGSCVRRASPGRPSYFFTIHLCFALAVVHARNAVFSPESLRAVMTSSLSSHKTLSAATPNSKTAATLQPVLKHRSASSDVREADSSNGFAGRYSKLIEIPNRVMWAESAFGQRLLPVGRDAAPRETVVG